MTFSEHPEFRVLFELQTLQQERDDPELNALIDRLINVVNENSITIVQSALLYVLLARPGVLRPDARDRLRELFQTALNQLDAGEAAASQG